jgi:hypothetical protein
MDAAKRLMSELEEIDTKIAENEATLRENNTNMISPLVDADDFPLAGIDLISVRQARHDIICAF